MVAIYTDGACVKNPGGAGGWAFCVPELGLERSGGVAITTNNRMELLAVIVALQSVSGPVVVYSDSEYVVKGATQWMPSWIQKGWRSKTKGPVKNLDLWQTIATLIAGRDVRFEWLRGHIGHPYNERCDRMANGAALRAERGIYTGWLE